MRGSLNTTLLENAEEFLRLKNELLGVHQFWWLEVSLPHAKTSTRVDVLRNSL